MAGFLLWLRDRKEWPLRRKRYVEDSARIGVQVATLATLPRRGFESLPPFGADFARADGLYYGQSDRRATVLCHYIVYGRYHNSTYLYTVICFQVGAALPEFSLIPHKAADAIFSFFGMQDFNFDSHTKFSKDYRLRGRDEASVRACFTPAVLSFFEQDSGWWYVHSAAGWLGVYLEPTRGIPIVFPSEKLPEILDRARQVCAQFVSKH